MASVVVALRAQACLAPSAEPSWLETFILTFPNSAELTAPEAVPGPRPAAVTFPVYQFVPRESETCIHPESHLFLQN